MYHVFVCMSLLIQLSQEWPTFSYANGSYCMSLRTICEDQRPVCAISGSVGKSVNFLEEWDFVNFLGLCQKECLKQRYCTGFNAIWPTKQCDIMSNEPNRFLPSDCCVYYHSNLRTDCTPNVTVNLARGVSTEKSQGSHTDRVNNADYTSCADFSNDNYGLTWVLIELGKIYKVQKVVVFNSATSTQSLSYVVIGVLLDYDNSIKIERDTFPVCGIFNGNSTGLNPLEVICSKRTLPGKNVVVQKAMPPYFAVGDDNMRICEIEVYATIPCDPSDYKINDFTYPDKKELTCPIKNNPNTPVQLNIARGRPVYASTDPNNKCCLCVDGDANTVFNTVSTYKGQHWIQIDLQEFYSIYFVIVTNPNTGDFLGDLSIGVSNIFQTNPIRNVYPMCGKFTGSSSNTWRLRINCVLKTIGRFLIIYQNEFSDTYQLRVSEIEAYGDRIYFYDYFTYPDFQPPLCPLSTTNTSNAAPMNLARGRPTYSEAGYLGGSSCLAVDGNTGPYLADGGCFSTNKTDFSDSYIILDLQGSYVMKTVVLSPTKGEEQSLVGVTFGFSHLKDTFDFIQPYSKINLTTKLLYYFNNNTAFRYFGIQANNIYLSLCEIEIYN